MNVKSAEVALQQLVTHLRCYICKNLPQNAHICPKCSEMYCYSCVSRLLTAGRGRINKCSKCRSPLELEQLIKLRCFETLDDINVGLDRLTLDDHVNPVPAVSPGGSGDPGVNSDFVSSFHVIPVGRQEPIEGLPPAVQGTFTLRNVHQCRLPCVFSERIVDEMGFMWRLKVSPKGEEQQIPPKMDVHVEMLHGEFGFFEVMIELTNFAPKAIIILNNVDTDTMLGEDEFLDHRLLPRGNVNLKFRYSIRPASHRSKVLLQQRLLHKHAHQLETMKGYCDTFMYYIYDYDQVDLKDEAFEEHVDQLGSTWRIGVHGKHNFAEFLLILDDGPPGFYEITFILTHPSPGNEKRLHYAKRSIQINQRHLFNFGVRWDELDSCGFVHDVEMLIVKVTIRPIHVDLKWVKNELTICGDLAEYDTDID